MNSKNAISAPRKDAAITQRYGKIGIPAVAAAARYQGIDKKDSKGFTSEADANEWIAKELNKWLDDNNRSNT